VIAKGRIPAARIPLMPFDVVEGWSVPSLEPPAGWSTTSRDVRRATLADAPGPRARIPSHPFRASALDPSDPKR